MMTSVAAPGAWAAAQKLDYASLSSAVPDVQESGIAQANPDIEEQLFGGANKPAGEALKALELNVNIEGPRKIVPVENFDDAGLHPVVRENIGRCGYASPTAIQGYCIPALLAENDIVAVAQTGSGKTAAYMIPIVSRLMGKVDKIGGPRVDTTAYDYNPDRDRVRAEPLVVIVCPTRELAHQIFQEARRISYRSKLLPVCVYGGLPLSFNVQQLSKGCDILIGTPGRLGSLMDKPHLLSMSRVK